jgi:type I restriction enzyme S subunit
MGDPRFFKGSIPFIKISDVTRSDGVHVDDSETKVNEEGAKRSRLLKKGSLILSNSATVCVPVFLGVDACIHDGFVAFEGLPDSVEQKFLYYFFKYIRPYILAKHKQGVTQVNLNTTLVGEIALPLPPTNEQRRIVAKIEELFSKLDAAIASLRAARDQLTVYRQAVLIHAFTGKLTHKWREENKDKVGAPKQILACIKQRRDDLHKRLTEDWATGVRSWEEAGKAGAKPRQPMRPLDVTLPTEDELKTLHQLPAGWLWIKVQELLLEPLANGHSVKDRVAGFPVLRLTAIKAGKLDLSENKSGDWERHEALPYLVSEGDFLLARGNGSKSLVGRGGLVPTVKQDVAYPDTMIRLRVDPELISGPFLAQVWDSHLLRHQIETAARTTAGIYKINQGHILNFTVPLCSRVEQDQIVSAAERQLSVRDHMEHEIDRQLRRAEALRHSILKEAFSGQLVAQNPSDAPASAFLERIRAERQASSTERASKKTTSRKRNNAA